MNKILRLIAIIIPIIVLAVYLLTERFPFGVKNASFAVDPEKELTSIEFSDGSKKLLLEKRGEEWIVNKKYEARKSSILFILKILTEMEIKSPVTPELFDKEITGKGIAPVRVKVSAKGRTNRSFLVYKTASNSYGNIMKLGERSKPFIVYVPGNEVEIGSAFTLNELFWQPYTVYNLLPSDIFSVSLENLSDTGSSFRIKNENRRLSLSDHSGELTGWDTSRVVRYLTYFTHVPFETWAFDISADEREKIKMEKPLYRITVVSPAGEIKVLTLWSRSVDQEGVLRADTDRLWGKTGDNDEIFIMRYTDIDPLLKKLSYFFPG